MKYTLYIFLGVTYQTKALIIIINGPENLSKLSRLMYRSTKWELQLYITCSAEPDANTPGGRLDLSVDISLYHALSHNPYDAVVIFLRKGTQTYYTYNIYMYIMYNRYFCVQCVFG